MQQRHILLRLIMSAVHAVPQEIPPYFVARVNRCLNEKKDLIFIFQQVAGFLYRHMLPREANIVVAGHVTNGQGDYHHNRAAAEIIHKAYRQWKITLMLSVDNYLQRANSFTLPDADIEVLFDDSNQEESKENKAITAKKIQNAAVVVNGPFKRCELIPEKIFQEIEPRLVHYYEYGWYIAPATGLRADDYGIIFKDPPGKTILAELEDEVLKQFLLVEGKQNDLTYGYMHTDPAVFDIHLQAFIIACSRAFAASNKILDILCPLKMILRGNWRERLHAALAKLADPSDMEAQLNIFSSFGFTKHQDFDLSYFKDCNIQKIQLFHKNQEGALECVEEVLIAQEGKTIRLINPFPISYDDAQIFSYLTPFVGATGDMSVTEAISYLKIPFYQMVHHKGEFLPSLIAIAKEQFEETSPLVEYLVTLNRLMTQIYNSHIQKKPLHLALRCGELMRMEVTAQQMRALCIFLKTHYSFNETLLNLVSRTIGRNLYPRLKEVEDAFGSALSQNKIAFTEACVQMQKAFQNV